MEQKDITVIIPAYNEEQGIVSVLNSVLSESKNWEILVVDDGSTDKTYELIKDMPVKIIRHPYNKGYGASLKTGMKAAKTEILVFLDADGQHDPKDIERLASDIEKYDMIVGARARGSEISLFRRLPKAILQIIANLLSDRKIPDLNSGFRVLKRSKALEFLHILPNTFSFTTTITIAMIQAGYDVSFVPIITGNREAKSKSKIRPINDTYLFIMLIIRTIVLFNPLKVFLPISITLFLLGMFSAINDILFLDRGIADTSIILVVSSLIIFFFSILADQIAAIRRERYR